MSYYIERQAAVDAINKAFERVFAWDGTDPLGDKVLENVPSVQPQRMRGRWETIEGWDGDEIYRCSECGAEFVLIDGTPKENGYHFALTAARI